MRERRGSPRGAAALLAALALHGAAGCSDPAQAGRTELIVPLERVLSRPPDQARGGVKFWGMPPGASMGMVYLEIEDSTSFGYHDGPASFFVVSGTADIRVGLRRETVGAGSYAYVPRRLSYVIRRVGPQRLVLACQYSASEGIFWHPLQAPLAALR